MAGTGGVLVAMNNTAYKKFIGELEPGGTLLYDSTLVTVPSEKLRQRSLPTRKPSARVTKTASAGLARKKSMK